MSDKYHDSNETTAARLLFEMAGVSFRWVGTTGGEGLGKSLMKTAHLTLSALWFLPGRPDCHTWVLLLFFFNWSVVDLQCCANFCCTAKWFSYTYIYIYTHTHFFFFNIPLWFIIGYSLWFSVLHSRTLLFIHSIHESLHLRTPASHSVSPPVPLPLATTRLFYMFVNLFLFHRYLCHILGCT